jgi:beta-N-acetylhexosaminidase
VAVVRTRGPVLSALILTACTVVVASSPASSLPLPQRRPNGAHLRTPAASGQRHEGCARRVLSALGLPKQVGQLFVAGVSSSSPTAAQLRVIRRRHLGGVILMGHTDIGVAATRAVTHRLQRQATTQSTDGVKLWVSVDQEGGYVQVLNGPGFSTIPTALAQGGLRRSVLRSRASRWGEQLTAAGVNLDLAPVTDTVPARLGTRNIPIGYYYREFGHHPKVVAVHGKAFIDGLTAAGVQTTVKHFPGLGRVRRNTDTSAGVTDRVTTRSDRYLRPFHAAVNDGVPVVMVSLARYKLIDPTQVAAFSPVVMTMLRSDLGFHGVIMSDSLTAVAVQDVPPGARAVRFLRAGGTVALAVTTPATAAMAAAVLHRAQVHRPFRRTVRKDALTVLRVKRRDRLLPCS